MILPKNYQSIFPCINECGASSVIYANADYTKAYKIYRNQFNFDEEKFKYYLAFDHPNCFFPTDVARDYDNPNLIVGYEMNFDSGIALSKIADSSLSLLITESLSVSETLKELSNNHFLIADPNVDNITFSTTYKFVDTYSYLLVLKYASETIYKRNITRVNDTVLCGLIGFSYKKYVERYLRMIDSKYLDLFIKSIQTKKANDNYIYDILSIVQEETKEDSLIKAKKRILELNK